MVAESGAAVQAELNSVKASIGFDQTLCLKQTRVFYERGGHTKLFHERGGQIFFITKREANGHLFHEKGGQKALQRLIAQLYLR